MPGSPSSRESAFLGGARLKTSTHVFELFESNSSRENDSKPTITQINSNEYNIKDIHLKLKASIERLETS